MNTMVTLTAAHFIGAVTTVVVAVAGSIFGNADRLVTVGVVRRAGFAQFHVLILPAGAVWVVVTHEHIQDAHGD